MLQFVSRLLQNFNANNDIFHDHDAGDMFSSCSHASKTMKECMSKFERLSGKVWDFALHPTAPQVL
jgi:hypothetical protein